MKHKNFIYLLILAMFLWAGGWSALKILTYNLSAEIIIFWRFFFMSISFLPILYFTKIPLSININSLKYIGSSSILNVAFMISSFYGVKYGLAGSGGVIITTLSPIMTFLLVALIFQKKLHNLQYFGLFLGLVGGFVMLSLENSQNIFDSSNTYYLLCAIIWAGVTLLSQHSQKYIHPIYYSFFISVVASISTFIWAYDFDLLAIFDQDLEFWIAMIYLSILAQTLATTIFFIASGKLGSEKTSSFMFLVPIFSLLIAHLLLDEPIEFHILLGGTLSLIAVIFINNKLS